MKFDTIVITAANAEQAEGYRMQASRLEGIVAPEIVVVPDPGGRRVGSLGSTVNVLRTYGRRLTGRRVLVCHSGGDSKRLPSYAAFGKAFVPVPQKDGTRPTLFEVIVRNMEKLNLPRAGVLIVCGDVAPTFDFAACDFSRPGVTGVGYWDSLSEGSRHGVYVAAAGKSSCRPVAAFLQKPTPEEARAAKACRREKVLVDTGVLWLDGPTCARLAKSGWKTGDIYEQFTAELTAGYAPFQVNVMAKATLFHIGSSAELLMRLGTDGVWVDGCEMPRTEMTLAGENIVTGVPRAYGKVALKRGECLMSLPIGETEWVHVVYRVTDTFKTDGKWEAFHMAELMRKVNPRRLAASFGLTGVTVENPLRIDLSGGWSDTPPICHVMGGCVLTAAITLNGVRPVKAFVRRLAVPEVRVESVDLGKSGILTSDREIADHSDPHDWGALVKSALTVVGYSLSEGGLEIRISADVPKGSGLGTSSILGATLIEALGKVRGQNYAWHEIAALTLRLEKEMCTGGGWEDQVGGIVPGVKLLRSNRGEDQKIRVRRLSPGASASFARFLADRALLYFTGRKRMARNVLRGVLNFFAENPEGIATAIIDRLKRDAQTAFDALEAGDYRTFCEMVNAYWLSKKALDAGSTNALVESIIARIAPWTSAVSLCGAGGGGFMFIVARDKASKARLRRVLENHPPVSQGRFYDLGIA